MRRLKLGLYLKQCICFSSLGITLLIQTALTAEGPPLFSRAHLPSEGFYENSKGSPIVDLIDQSSSTLKMEIYEMDDPKVIHSIRRAIGRGVTVDIVKEPNPVGASCRVFETESVRTDLKRTAKRFSNGADCEDQSSLVKEVNQAGGHYVAFTKPDLCGGNGTKTCLQHGKLAVIDSKVALISSGNFNTTNLCDLDYSPMTCNRDYTFVTHQPSIVHTLESVVDGDLTQKRYDLATLLASPDANSITVGPNSLEPLLSFIQSAQVKIQVENQYLKEPTLNAALVQAANRGIDVQVVIASACSFGKPKGSDLKRSRLIFEDFDQAGIKTKMFNKKIKINGRSGYLHAKAIVVDQHQAWIGSVNGSTQAATLNREFGIFFDDPIEVGKLVSRMDEDFNDPNEETWEESLNCAENSLI